MESHPSHSPEISGQAAPEAAVEEETQVAGLNLEAYKELLAAEANQLGVPVEEYVNAGIAELQQQLLRNPHLVETSRKSRLDFLRRIGEDAEL